MAEKVTKTRLETVEHDVFLCDGCGQEVEDDQDLITVAVDVYDNDTGEMGTALTYHRRRGFCQFCAESLFDYERPKTEKGRKYVDPLVELAPPGFFAKVGFVTTAAFAGLLALILFILLPVP